VDDDPCLVLARLDRHAPGDERLDLGIAEGTWREPRSGRNLILKKSNDLQFGMDWVQDNLAKC
jgi:hypothetical protein